MNFGCTGITLKTADNSHVFGRTYDFFGDLSGNTVGFYPKGHALSFSGPDIKGDEIALKYGFIGMAIDSLKTPILVDGINEKGLIGALLNFPDYGSFKKPKLGKTNIHPAFFVSYILSQFKTVKEIVKIISELNLTDELIMGHTMSVHYLFYDKSGEAVIIEPSKDGIAVYRNSIGILANSPEYSWHITNLRNYSKVDNLPSGKRKLSNIEISEFGLNQGGGFGLPGGYSSPARFVRCAFLREYAKTPKDESEAINLVFSILKSVDIPLGIIAGDNKATHFDTTLCTTAACCESLVYYYKTHKSGRLCALRLRNLLKERLPIKFDLPKEEDILFLV